MILLRHGRGPWTYGLPIDLTDISHEWFYTDFPVASADEWLDSVGIGLLVALDTGYDLRARRRVRGDYIELREAGGWRFDERFYVQVDDSDPERIRFDAYENNATGGPFVARAVLRTGAAEATLEPIVQLVPDVPPTVLTEIALMAVHLAEQAGARSVVTTAAGEHLDIAGFATGPDGRRTAETSLLAADPDRARAQLQASLELGEGCGRDRDIAGRRLPASRAGRLLHRVRHPLTGLRPRMYAG